VASLTFHGHAAVFLETDTGHTVLIDPWLDDNPLATIGRADVRKADYILCTHGHFDHFADVIPLARQTGAMLVGTFEIVAFAQSRGIENAHAMSIGGGYDFPFGYVKMTAALHGGQIDGANGEFSTLPAGFLIELLDGPRLYHAGDTALLTDMQLLRGRVDVALLPIGDNFTMGPADAARAVDFIEPGVVIPIHYNTFDLIRQDAEAFARRVGDRARVVVLEPGESYEL
jgi:L-ascorbate metabolism protein UlaG (beta-lactamase superfamily)